MFLYTLFAVLLVAGISSYAFFFSTGILRKQETEILEDSLQYLEQSLSAQIESVNDEFRSIFEDTNFMQLYLRSAAEDKEKSEQIRLDNDFLNYFLDIKLRNHSLVDVVYMHGEDDNIYSSEYNFKLSSADFKNKPYYISSMLNKNKILFENVESEDEYFHILRSFYFMNNEGGGSVYPSIGYTSDADEDYSVLIFSLKKSYLSKLLKKEADKRQTGIIIYDSNGGVVVSEGNFDWLNENGRDEITEKISECRADGFEGDFTMGHAGIHVRNMALPDWNIVYVYDLNILYRQAGAIHRVILILFAISLVVVFLIATFVSGTVTKPIRELTESMEQTVENNMEVNFTTKYNDEIGYLGGKYRELMEQIALLLENVKQAEKQKHAEQLKALQAQINPHFLYNTLDMVYWMAKMEKQDKIANLIADLADFFRLSLNKGEDITTVKKEMEHARKYMEIQKTRMENKFDYEVYLPKELEESRVPKLILQPFVENALLHGFERLDYQGHISITAKKSKNDIVFTIEDNGCGMDNELCERLNQYHKANHADSEDHGYAIENVWERIMMYSGNENSLEFESSPGNGTRISVRFPLGFMEEQKDD